MSAPGNLTRALAIIDDVLYLIHGTYMAAGVIEDAAERGAIRSLAHITGENLDEAREIIKKHVEAGGGEP